MHQREICRNTKEKCSSICCDAIRSKTYSGCNQRRRKKFYNELEIDPALSKEELIGHNTDELEKKRQACKELGYTHGDYEGDELQLPALFIVNKKGIITYVKYGDSLVSLPTVDELIDLL